MTELTEFKWANNSLTTIPQQKVISKLSSHFGVPNKQLRAALDVDAAKERNLVKFSYPDNPLSDWFYPISVKFRLAELIHTPKFLNSKLYAAYTLMMARSESAVGTFVAYDASLHVICDANSINLSRMGGGGVLMNHNNDFRNMILLPIDTFLKAKYPLPSS